MYIETSAPRSIGQVARLMSPAYNKWSTPVCTLTFWYHMYGGTIGTLNVYEVRYLTFVFSFFNFPIDTHMFEVRDT